MINHARTLLYNRDGDAEYLSGDQYVPPEFKQLELSSALLDIRARLFGTDPDRAMRNYRLAQFMSLLHAAELGEYVLALDTRITYADSNYVSFFAKDTFKPEFTAINTSENFPGTSPLLIAGSPMAPDATGKMRYDFTVTADKDVTGLTLEEIAPFQKRILSSLPADSDGFYPPVALSNSGYNVAVPASGGIWKVTFMNRPQWDMGQLAAVLTSSGEPTLLELFGASPEEPYRTFKNLFFTNDELIYRLGGLLLALIYRTEEVRRAAGQS